MINHFRKTTCLFLLLIFSIGVTAQDTVYARTVINKLCSPKFHGRGYVKNGDDKAAVFIANEFKNLNVKKFEGNYFQKFSFPVNTFPNKMELEVNGKKLIAGADFIIHPSSGGVKEKYTAAILKLYSGSGKIIQQQGKCFVVIKRNINQATNQHS